MIVKPVAEVATQLAGRRADDVRGIIVGMRNGGVNQEQNRERDEIQVRFYVEDRPEENLCDDVWRSVNKVC